MADTTNASAAGTPAEPNAAPVQPQAGNSGTNATANPGTLAEPAGTPSSDYISLDEAKKLRAEAASLRKRIAEYDAAQQAAADAQLSETQKLQKQHAQLQEQNAALLIELQQARLVREVATHAAALNIIDPDAAMLMLQAGGELTQDPDSGQYTNVAKLLEKLIADKPYLIASNVRPMTPAPSSGGATNPGRSVSPAGAPQPTNDPKAAYKAHRQGGGLANPALWKRNP